MVRIALALLLLFCSPALAGKNDATWNPPPEYDHPYSGKLEKRYRPQAKIMAECSALFVADTGNSIGAYPGMKGCSIQKPGHCIVVVIDKPVAMKGRPGVLITPEAVLRHEIGHCNGWTHAID